MGHWYYGENGQQIGPVDEGAIRVAMGDGRINLQTLVWREGMPNWQPLAQVAELSGAHMAPAPYGAPPGGYGASYPPYSPYAPGAGRTSGLAISSMVCGILGIIGCFPLLGVPAVICGHMAMGQIDNGAIPLAGRGMALSGLIMGYIQLIMCIVVIVAIAFGSLS